MKQAKPLRLSLALVALTALGACQTTAPEERTRDLFVLATPETCDSGEITLHAVEPRQSDSPIFGVIAFSVTESSFNAAMANDEGRQAFLQRNMRTLRPLCRKLAGPPQEE